jgi:hypothetical protein
VQQGRASVGESPRPLRGPARYLTGLASQRADDRAACVRGAARPPAELTEDRVADGQQRWPAAPRLRVEQQRAALVGVTLPRRPQLLVKEGCGAVDRCAEPLPGCLAQRAVGCRGLDGRQQPEFRVEALVAGGKLTADARRERVAVQFALEQARGLPPPAAALRKPREGAASHELSGRLGDDVVVADEPGPERGEVLLMPADLPHRQLVMLEQAGDAGPVSSRRRIRPD